MMSFLRARHNLLLNAAVALFLLAVVTLVWRQGNFLTSGVPKFFEVLIIAVFGVLTLSFAASPSGISSFASRPAVRKIAALFGALLLFTVVGHLVSVSLFPEWRTYRTEAWTEYGRMFFVAALLFATAYLAVVKPKFERWALAAVAFSPLVFWTALLPRMGGFLLSAGRLWGPRSDPNYLATWIAMAALIALAFFLHGEGKKRWVWLLASFFVAPLILWTGSRGGWFAFVVSGAVLGVWYLVRQPRHFWVAALALAAVAFSVLFALRVLPLDSRQMIFLRFIAPFLSESAVRSVVGDVSPGSLLREARDVEFNERHFGFGQNRPELARLAFAELNRFSLGLGPAYVNWRPPLILPDGRKQGPHNTFLEVGLTAGYAGLAVWLAIVGMFFRYAVSFFRRGDAVGVALASCFLALLVSFFFLDMLTVRWLWLVMGFMLARRMREGPRDAYGS